MTAAALAVSLTAPVGASAADHAVTASSNVFTPAHLVVTVGDRVRWTNSGGDHNVRFDDGSFDDPMNPSTAMWTTAPKTFTGVGAFRYYCEVHGGPGGVGMAGIVTVTAAAGTSPESPPGPTPPVGPPPTGPVPARPPLKVTLKVSDSTPLAGRRVRLSGVVRPARDGRKVHIQKRARNGGYRTIAGTRLRDAGAAKSRFRVRVRISGDVLLRARVAGDATYATGTSATRSVDARKRGGR